MKTTFALVAFSLCSVCASGLFGQQTYPVAYANPPMPVGRYIANDGQSVTAFGAQANQAISSELGGGGHGGCSSCGSGCCNTGCCQPACSDCACNDCNHCCASKCNYGCCLHRTGGFADYLYLSPRNSDLSYAIPQDGIGAVGTVPMGDVGILDLNYSSGVRFGFNAAIDCCSSISASYTTYDTDTTDAISVNAPNVIQPLTSFPGTFNAGFTAQQAAASYDLEYRFVDLDYRAVLWSNRCAWVNYMVGARYAHMDTAFGAIYPFAPPDGTTFVGTDINFDGGGIRFGLEGERRIFRRSGLSVYSKAYISALAGRFTANYVQANQFNGLEAQVGWFDDRVVTISELEVGLNWTNHRGNIKVGGGYYIAVWNNVVTTPEWINSVQQVNFTNVGHDANDTQAFDGLVIHAEFMF